MVQPGVKKMGMELKLLFFWKGMKKDIVNFVARCLECQRVNVGHIHPTRLPKPHEIPEFKWEVISIDFIVRLPLTTRNHGAILVVDTLNSCCHISGRHSAKEDHIKKGSSFYRKVLDQFQRSLGNLVEIQHYLSP